MTEPKLRCWPGCTARLDDPGNLNHGMHFLVLRRAGLFDELFHGGPAWDLQPLGLVYSHEGMHKGQWIAGEGVCLDELLVPVDPLADPESVTTDQRIPEVA